MPALTWDPSIADGGSPLTGYRLHMLTAAGEHLALDVAPGATSATMTTDMASTDGRVWVTALNALGESQMGQEITYTAPVDPGSIETPSDITTDPVYASITGTPQSSGLVNETQLVQPFILDGSATITSLTVYSTGTWTDVTLGIAESIDPFVWHRVRTGINRPTPGPYTFVFDTPLNVTPSGNYYVAIAGSTEAGQVSLTPSVSATVTNFYGGECPAPLYGSEFGSEVTDTNLRFSLTTPAAPAGFSFSDNFNRADGPLAAPWLAGGTEAMASIDANEVGPTLPYGGAKSIPIIDAGTPDVTVTLKNVLGGDLAPAVRYVDADNYLCLRGASLYTYIGGGGSPQGDFSSAPVAGDVVALTAVGSTYQLNINGVDRGTITYANATFEAATKHGVFMYDSALRFDDFSIESA